MTIATETAASCYRLFKMKETKQGIGHNDESIMVSPKFAEWYLKPQEINKK